MSCSSCKYLKENNKYDGAITGCIYYCSKMNNYVNGANNSCDKYELAYSRKYYLCNKIYKDGETFYDDTTPNSFYLFVLAFLIILGIILKVF